MVAGSIPINKVYIDSRFKTKDSKSNSDFKYEPVESIQLPDTCVCVIDDVIIQRIMYFSKLLCYIIINSLIINIIS